MQQRFSNLLRLIAHTTHRSCSGDLHIFSLTNGFNCTDKCSVADPNPACHFDADPDPTFHFRADPDPSFQIKAKTLKKCSNRLIFYTFWLVICKLMRSGSSFTFIRIRIRILPFNLTRIQTRNNGLVID
jgi:hypothetical protein